MLLLLSHFSRVRLCATPQTAAHQALPSLGFSRQEHWSGVHIEGCKHSFYVPWETKKLQVTHFMMLFALLWWPETEPVISPRSAYT